jgi:nicotinamidase-related amidase
MQQIAETYLRKLRDNQRYYPLVVWPEHCRVGTPGWNVHPDLMQALDVWEETEFAKVDYIIKGTNAFTEMYSAIRADVIDESDPSTHPNMNLIYELQEYDCIVVAGEALSHCVANTVRDLVACGIDPKKVVLLTDAMSNVTGFDGLGEAFLEEMKGQGMLTSTTTALQL